MKKLPLHLLALCFGLPLFAWSCPDTTIHIYKDSMLGQYPVLRLEWQLLVNGVVTQKGGIPVLTLSSKHPTALNIPAKLPSRNEEVFLRLVFRRPSHPTPILTRLVALRPWGGDYTIPPAGELVFSDSNDVFSITSPAASLRFDKQTGWLLHYEAGRLVLVEDSAGLRPALWPSDITQPRLQLFSASTGSQLVIVRTEYTLPEVSCLLHMSYTINAAGDMLVGQSLEADSTKRGPLLSGFGMSWIVPVALDSVVAYAGTTDAPASPELFHIALPMTPPTPIRWLTITGADGKGIRIIADSCFLQFKLSGKTLAIQRPVRSLPLPYGNFQFVFKVSPVAAKRF
jgi:beta-galactosidase